MKSFTAKFAIKKFFSKTEVSKTRIVPIMTRKKKILKELRRKKGNALLNSWSLGEIKYHNPVTRIIKRMILKTENHKKYALDT